MSYQKEEMPHENRPLTVHPTQINMGGNRFQPSYEQDVAISSSKHGCYEMFLTLAGNICGLLGTVPCLPFPNPYKVVEQGGVGLLEKFGKCVKIVDPGLHRINFFTENLRKIDIKLRVGDIPRQCVMTKDNIAINIDSVLCYNIVDPYAAVYLVENVHSTLIERTQTTLRQVIGMRNLQDCIENREIIAHEIQDIIAEPAKTWGAMVESILIKDMILSKEIIESLSSAAVQCRIGESKVIAAKAEVRAAEEMKKASDILSTKSAMQMRYLDTLQNMAKSGNVKVIFMPLSQNVSEVIDNVRAQEIL